MLIAESAGESCSGRRRLDRVDIDNIAAPWLALALPTDEGSRRHHRQCAAPIEPTAEQWRARIRPGAQERIAKPISVAGARRVPPARSSRSEFPLLPYGRSTGLGQVASISNTIIADNHASVSVDCEG